MATHHLSLLPLLILTTLVVSSTSINPLKGQEDLVVATQEMARANYFAYVMLINMAPPDPRLQSNITFLMPKDKLLASSRIPEGSILPFLLRHSIPSALLIDHLDRIPSGSILPSSDPSYTLSVSNKGRRDFHLNNVRIISPNLCTSEGTTIRCHGIDGVLLEGPGPFIPPDCPRNMSIPAGMISNPPPIGQVITPPDPLVQLPPGTLPVGFPDGGHPPPESPNKSGSPVITRCVSGWKLCLKLVNVVMVLLVGSFYV